MEQIWTFLVNFFVRNQESLSLKEGTLIIVLISLLVALTISFIVAKKNHLYGSNNRYDEPMSESKQLQ